MGGDISDVIDYVLRQSAWQPDPANIAMCGISYGAGLSLLGASVDSRVKTVVAMSGWQTLERALFEESTPNKIWGDILVKLANWLGHPEPTLQYMFDQVLAGNESAFKEFAAVRSPALYQAQLEARQVPIFFSNNMEDRLFHPQDTLDFFNSYSGPKRLLLNQGIHATAEIGGLVNFPGNHVWIEAKIWIAHYLKGAPASWPMVEMRCATTMIAWNSPHGRLIASRWRPFAWDLVARVGMALLVPPPVDRPLSKPSRS